MKRWDVGVVVLVALTTPLTACDGGLGNATVGIVGDSITNFAGCAHDNGPTHCGTEFTQSVDGVIGTTFQNDYAVALDAWSGQTIATMEPYVKQRANDGNHVMIIELGTNDASLGNPDWENDYAAVLNDIADTSCVVLVTAPLFADTLYASNNNGTRLNIAAQLNEFIGATAYQHSNTRVVDYAAHLRDTPGFSADGLHPTSIESQQWLADQYKAAADSCPP